MSQKIIIGTRGSKLALQQAEIIKSKLCSKISDLEVQLKIIKTEGDTNNNPIPLDTIGKGWFTQEIENQLLDGTIDIAVHSLKDLPEDLPAGLEIKCFPERQDPRDVLVSKNNLKLEQLPQGAIVGTDSTRREIQLLALRPDLKVKSVRGNVPTRLQKLQDQDYEAIVLAAAGLKRLGLQDRITQYFEPDILTPAPGQGILAAEVRTGNQKISKLLESINDPEAELAALAERNFSKVIGGGCKEPVGAYAVRNGDNLTLLGMVGIPNGAIVLRKTISGQIGAAVDLSAALAGELLEQIKSSNAGK